MLNIRLLMKISGSTCDRHDKPAFYKAYFYPRETDHGTNDDGLNDPARFNDTKEYV